MKKIIVCCCMASLLCSRCLYSRSSHRPLDSYMPSIATCWQDDPTHTNALRSPYLDAYPFFEIFDYDYLKRHALPVTAIPYRYDQTRSVAGKDLIAHIEQLVKEVRAKKSVYTHFAILRDRNFNRALQSGLLIVQDKEYPFVVKLFMEKPGMFVRPLEKGFEPIFFYFMGGGINRHLSGFTRIKNAEDFMEKIKHNPYWASRVDVPRKWFFIPAGTRWITISGSNIGSYKHIKKDIPSCYCVVADKVDLERTMTLLNPEDRIESLALCNFAKFSIDPHIDNFAIERHTKKIVLVDTEHFPSMVGFKKTIHTSYRSQTAWYVDLASKGASDVFLRDKRRWH